MRIIFCVLILVVTSSFAQSKDENRNLDISCEDFSWHDVEQLAQPYLDDTLYTALVMQGQSADYRVSAAAKQAMDKSLPKVIQGILGALIKAGC